MAKGKKTPADGDGSGSRGRERSRASPASAEKQAPFVLTLRDVEVPLPTTEAVKPVNDGLVVSDSRLWPEPSPNADRAAEPPPLPAKAATPVEQTLVVSDSGLWPEPRPDADRPVEPPPPPAEAAAPAAQPLVESDSEPRPEPYLGDPEADRAAQRAARRAQVRRDRARDAETGTPDVPQMLVLSADDDACRELCELLRAFGFGVLQVAAPPPLPAPWPFAAVFVAAPMRGVEGGDAIDLCNHVRETSRLPGEKKPVLVLAAPQLSATDRVRAGLAGCNEILIGAPTRGGVAQLLDTRGIALPSDARRG